MAVVKLDTTAISEEELLVQVRELNDYGENDLDDPKLKALIVDAKNYLRINEVDELLVNSVSAVNVIAYYVDDMMRKVGISNYVEQRIGQLRMWKNV